jgi:hypothetical protein
MSTTDLSAFKSKLALAARAKFQSPEAFDAMRQRLYRAVLTASSQAGLHSNGLGGSNSSGWMAGSGSGLVDVDDHIKIISGAKRSKRVSEDLSRAPRYQPTARDLDVWLDDIGLLNGFGLIKEAEAKARLAEHDLATDKLQKRLTGLMNGSVPATFEVRQKRIGEIQLEFVVRGRTRKGLVEVVEINTGLGRKALGVLKGAAFHYMFGGPRNGLNKWQYAAKWGGIESQLLARQLHDECIYWAMAGEMT